MSVEKSKPFVRNFPPALQERLKASTAIWNKLHSDIQACEVFPAIRDGKMHFYHKGGRLLEFNGSRIPHQRQICPCST